MGVGHPEFRLAEHTCRMIVARVSDQEHAPRCPTDRVRIRYELDENTFPMINKCLFPNDAVGLGAHALGVGQRRGKGLGLAGFSGRINPIRQKRRARGPRQVVKKIGGYALIRTGDPIIMSDVL